MPPMLVFLLAMWLAIMREPGTSIARAVWHLTVTAPIAWADRVRRGHVLTALMLVLVALVLLYSLGREGVQLLAMSGPDIAAWLTAFEISTYVDALAAVALAASTLRVQTTWSRIRSFAPKCLQVAKAGYSRAPHRHAQRLVPANDDDERWMQAA